MATGQEQAVLAGEMLRGGLDKMEEAGQETLRLTMCQSLGSIADVLDVVQALERAAGCTQSVAPPIAGSPDKPPLPTLAREVLNNLGDIRDRLTTVVQLLG